MDNNQYEFTKELPFLFLQDEARTIFIIKIKKRQQVSIPFSSG